MMRAAQLILLVLALSACGKSEWQELAVSDAGFSVLMRGQPRYTRQQLDTPAGKMSASLYSSDRPDAFYAVGYSDYPLAMVIGSSPEQLFTSVRDTWVRRVDGKLIANDDRIKLAGKYAGYDFTAEGKVKGADAFVQARFYLVDQRLYQIIAMGRKGEVSQGTINRFLNSFKLIEQSEVGTMKIEPAAK